MESLFTGPVPAWESHLANACSIGAVLWGIARWAWQSWQMRKHH